MTEWIANGESGASVRAKLNAIPFKGTAKDITTGSSITVISAGSNDLAETDIYKITTGGTGGDEFIHLWGLPFTQPVSGPICAPESTGRRVQFVVAAQTNPGDVVKIVVKRPNGLTDRIIATDAGGVFDGEFAVSDYEEIAGGAADPFALLDYEGATAGFVWGDLAWFYETLSSNNDTVFAERAFTSDGNGATIKGRNFSSASQNGGDVNISSGAGHNGGQRGGNISLTIGQGSGGADPGNMIINNLPTTDPGISNPSLIGKAVWLNSGVLTISIG